MDESPVEASLSLLCRLARIGVPWWLRENRGSGSGPDTITRTISLTFGSGKTISDRNGIGQQAEALARFAPRIGTNMTLVPK
jgi:hypothetical protein